MTVSLLGLILTIFLGAIIILNSMVYPESLSSLRFVAIVAGIIGFLFLLLFLKGRSGARIILLFLSGVGALITVWAMFWGWVFQAPIPLAIYLFLLVSLFSILLLMLRSTRSYFIVSTKERSISKHYHYKETSPPEDTSNRKVTSSLEETSLPWDAPHPEMTPMPERGPAPKMTPLPETGSSPKMKPPPKRGSSPEEASPSDNASRDAGGGLRNLVISLAVALHLTLIVFPVRGDISSQSVVADQGLSQDSNSKTYDGFCAEGRACRQSKAWKRAAGCFWQATQLDPDKSEAFYYLGESFGKMQKVAWEMASLRKAISLSPLRWEYHDLYGIESYSVREEEKAGKEYLILKELNLRQANEFRRWMNADPPRANAFVQGLYYLRQAAFFYRWSLTFFPSDFDLEEVGWRLGWKRVSEEEIEEALDSIEGNPYDPRTNFALGYLYYRRGELEKSISYYLDAERLGFEDGELYYWLGRAYLEQDNPWKALIYYDYLRKRGHSLAPRLLSRIYPI